VIWLIYVCMILATAGVLLLTMFIDGVIDLIADWQERRS
jgi:hypothetical protein